MTYARHLKLTFRDEWYVCPFFRDVTYFNFGSYFPRRYNASGNWNTLQPPPPLNSVPKLLSPPMVEFWTCLWLRMMDVSVLYSGISFLERNDGLTSAPQSQWVWTQNTVGLVSWCVSLSIVTQTLPVFSSVVDVDGRSDHSSWLIFWLAVLEHGYPFVHTSLQ
jgi:hypothetical protein